MLKKQISKFENATIYISDGIAYLPTQTRYETEQAVDSEPVYICGLNQHDIVEVIDKILNAQKERLPEPKTMAEIYKRASTVILKATKYRSWSQLAKHCSVYMITWRQDETIISASQLDKRGRYEFPSSLQRRYPSSTPLESLVKIILDDVESKIQTERLLKSQKK